MRLSAPNTPSLETDQAAPVRLRLRVKGVVQGVGFRPTVYQLATALDLSGWVRNTPLGVEIEIQGCAPTVDTFQHRLQHNPPAHWAIQGVDIDRLALQEPDGFVIRDSTHTDGRLCCSIPPDLATCDDCRHELFDPNDRRFGYPFTNCTACGPRYSIITDLPYDRSRTTMDAFEMCPACQAEYDDPNSRRFHAQPNACPACGPQLSLMTMSGRLLSRQHDALDEGCRAIREGKIVAVKGLGGYHLMADTSQPDAIERLRQRKHRPDKPFALMAPTVQVVEAICHLSNNERSAICSSRAPIVLLRRRVGRGDIADGVAPKNPYLGVMLPATPLHHLMINKLQTPIVATSGNLSDEPICIDAPQALKRLGSIADLMLTHDRPIARQVDDSVVQEIDNAVRVIRLARGYAPQRIALPVTQTTEPILAMGAQQKSAIGLVVNNETILSQHIGDLASAQTIGAHRTSAADLQRLLHVAPSRVAADLHPDYQSTRDAERLGLPVFSVQHHAAHVYGAMAEHGLDAQTTVLGAAWDGTGLGDEGTAWGGELLRIQGSTIERVGHLVPFGLPGGDKAAREPWRSAIGVLYAVFGSDLFRKQDLPVITRIPEHQRRVFQQMLEKGINSPTTTSAGRLFDAVAALLDLEQDCSFEGQAAMALQFAAESCDAEVPPLRMEISSSRPMRLDWRPAIKDIMERLRHGEPVSSIAYAFHLALAEGLARLFELAADEPHPAVVLSGGCFQSKLLTELTAAALRNRGILPLLHQDVPPNDGGLALGQMYAAALNAENHPKGAC